MTLKEKLDYIVKTYYGGSTDSYIENFYYALEQAGKRNSEYIIFIHKNRTVLFGFVEKCS